MELCVVPLHKHKHFIQDCCRLINDEWKRSDTARLRSLESSSDRLPTNLILLKDNQLIGHVKLSPIPSISDACFVESVVIERQLRGQGYGTILMKQTEEYCRNYLYLKSIYLSTKGQENFYNKLGYTQCLPISIYGTYRQPITTNQCKEINRNLDICTTKTTAPIPPPLPTTNHLLPANTKTFMMKNL